MSQVLPGFVYGTDTIDFFTKYEVSLDRLRDVTYGQIVCNYQEEKEDPYWAWLVVGGNWINYTGLVGTLTADMFTVKLFFNSAVSTPGSKFFTVNIRTFYLIAPLKCKEYVRLKLIDIPEDVVDHWN